MAFCVEVVVDESTQKITVDANPAIENPTTVIHDETIGQEDEMRDNVSSEQRMVAILDVQAQAHQAPEILCRGDPPM